MLRPCLLVEHRWRWSVERGVEFWSWNLDSITTSQRETSTTIVRVMQTVEEQEAEAGRTVRRKAECGNRAGGRVLVEENGHLKSMKGYLETWLSRR